MVGNRVDHWLQILFVKLVHGERHPKVFAREVNNLRRKHFAERAQHLHLSTESGLLGRDSQGLANPEHDDAITEITCS
jgi:hypothetical protein